MTPRRPTPTAAQRRILERLTKGWRFVLDGGDIVEVRGHTRVRSTVSDADERAMRRAGWVWWGTITAEGRRALGAGSEG
jgi:hypothetical protein